MKTGLISTKGIQTMNLFCTYGSGQPGHPGYVRVEGPDYGACRNAMYDYSNGRFAFDYDSLDKIHPLDKIERKFLLVTSDGRVVDGYEDAKRQCLEMAHECGLETVGEAVSNLQIHAMQLYPYSEINQRLLDVNKAFEDTHQSTKVCELLGPERCRALDAEMMAEMMADMALSNERLLTAGDSEAISLADMEARYATQPLAKKCEGENCCWPEYGHSEKCEFK